MKTAFSRRATLALSSLVLGVLFAAILPSAATAAEIRRAEEPVAGRYIVTVSPMTADVAAVATELAKTYDGKVLTVWRHAVKGFWIRISAENAGKLARDKRVVAIEEDARAWSSSGAGSQPTGPSTGDALWHLTRISHRDARLASTDPDYYNYRWASDGQLSDGQHVTVYLIDAGVLATHSEFVTKANVPTRQLDAVEPSFVLDPSKHCVHIDGELKCVENNFIAIDPSLSTAPCLGTVVGGQFSAHGTATASMVVGKTLGVAKGAVVVSVNTVSCKTGNDIDTSVAALINAIDWIAADAVPYVGARKLAVVSMSMFRKTGSVGTSGCANYANCALPPNLEVLEAAINELIRLGIPVVASANNQLDDACGTTPTRLSRRGGMLDQSGNPTRVISVGGTDRNDKRLDITIGTSRTGSNYGQCVDIWAPGEELRVAVPPDSIEVSSGTSYSAPIVAGLIARMISDDPSLVASQATAVDNVWNRLKQNATRLDALPPRSDETVRDLDKDLGPGASPLLAYLGSATFLTQPSSQYVTSGSSVVLSVGVRESNIDYQWYRGTVGNPQTSVDLNVNASSVVVCADTPPPGVTCNDTLGAGGKQAYWVRVLRRAPLSGHYADSNPATVENRSCVPPTITQQPKSFWWPEQRVQLAEVPRSVAIVQSPESYCYRWERIDVDFVNEAPQSYVLADAITAYGFISGGATPTTLTYEPLPAKRTDHYFRLRTWLSTDSGSCGNPVPAASCLVTSDTAQARFCTPPEIQDFTDVSRAFDPLSGDSVVRSELLAKKAQTPDFKVGAYTWLFCESACGSNSNFAPLNHGFPDWNSYHERSIRPPRAGYYRARIENSCGAATSNTVHITQVCDYALGGKIAGIHGDNVQWQSQSDLSTRVLVQSGATAKLTVSPRTARIDGSLVFPSPRVPFMVWSGQGNASTTTISGDTFTTAPITGDTSVTVTSTDPETNCQRTLIFSLGVDSQQQGGLASPAVQMIEVGTSAVITASVPGVVLDSSTIYEWRSGTEHDASSPVIPGANGPILTVTAPPDDVSFWCRISHQGQVYDTNIATIVVSCSGVDGSIVVNPVSHHVARGQLPKISAIGNGKLLTYEWRRTIPPETTPSYFAFGPAIMPSVSHEVTYFGATATDACGTTNSFSDVAIYLCVPTIEEQPQPLSIVAPNGVDAQGDPVGTATLNIEAVAAIAGQDVNVTWYRSGYNNGNGNPGVGQGATTTVSVAAGTSATFYAIVSSPCADSSDGVVYSEQATVEVCSKPVITGQSPNRNIVDGNATTIVVVATGNELTYQWYVGQSGSTSSPLNGRTDSSLEITPTNTTSYWCRITSRGVCTTDSQTITVNLCWTPVITAQPQSKRIFGGSTVLSIGVDAGFNAQPVVYQWQRLDSNGWANIAGATTPTYTTPSLTTQTTYRVQLVVGACFVTSEEATVSICTYPEIIEANPVETRTSVGQEVTLRVIASPVLDSIIRWYEGESGDPSLFVGGGYINSSLTVSPTVTKKYWAAIEYDGCVSRTTTYTVRVCKPTITTQPAGSSITQSQSATLSVGTLTLAGQTFQWYTGASGTTTSPVAGQTSSTLTVTPSITTSYWVRVTGTCDVSKDSDAATVTVCVPPVISSTSGPVVAIRSGESRTIQVNSTGTDRTYKWYIGQPGNITQPIANSDASSITVNPSATTSYWARVTSIGLCSTDSGSITVDVCTLPVFSVQPQSQTSFSGNALILNSAASSSTGTVTYQWYQGVSGTTTTPISGAISSTVTVSPTTQTSYWVRAKSSICETDSDTATIDMCVYPEEVAPSPAEKLIEYGASATLSLPLMSPVDSKYVTWYRGAAGDRTNIVGAGMNASFTTPALTTTTSYWAEFTHNACVSRMTAVTVTVCKPTITTQPTGASIQSGQSTSLTVGTTALAGQIIQWYVGAPGSITSPVSGGTSTTVSVSPTVTTSYWARVTGTCGTSVDSAAATITVCNPPVIGIVSPTRYIVSGSSTPINTNATGSNLTYKWYIGASGTTTNPVANSSTSGITVSPGTTTSYWAQIKSEGLCVTNGPAILVDVCTTPVITTQPQTQTIRIGQPAALSVATTAVGATYQWYQGAPGTTTTPLGTTAAISVSPTDDAQYWVRITRGACSIDSAGAMVTVCKLTASVANVNAASGQSVTLTATVTNARASLTHWWYRGNSGDTSVLVDAGYKPQITVSRTATTNYWVRVTDGTCTIDSATATLNLCVPTISTQPQSVVVMTGQSTTLTVAATGSPLTYQWYAGDSGVTTNPIAGATSASYTTPTLTTETRYWVRVSGCSAANSNTAVVTVCIPPSTPSAPTKSGGAYPTNSATLSISATGTGLTYQWYKGPSGDTSRPISGATGATYNFTLSVSEYYWVRVTGTCGTPANSSAILYSVTPTITVQPQNTAVPSGSSATFSVTATGNFITYQWYLGPFTSSPISGATSSTLVTGPVTANTTYWVKVMSGTTSTNSAQAVASPCVGPGVYLSASPQGAHNWKLMMTVSNEDDIGLVRYQWYLGTPGNVALSTPQGDGWGPYYKYVYNVTTPQTWWVRAWYIDDSCYTDTSGATIN